jgi:parvulin-like peptidyl-prolyl isomerase
MKFIKEPFVQFLLIGAIIFAASGFFAEPSDEESLQIIISEKTVQAMRARLQKRFEGQLSAEEIEAKFNAELDYKIRQEILYREGLERGLDKEDSVVKSRVASKMKRIAMEMADGEPFTNEQIESYYIENQASFTQPKRISFGQILFSSEERGGQVLSDCKDVLTQIQAVGLKDYSEMEKQGDQDPAIRGAFNNTTLARVKGIFGSEFATELDRNEQTGLIGPVASKHGYHIVEIRKVAPAQLNPLEKVQIRVERKLEFERNESAFTDFYEGVKEDYTLVIEGER